MRPKFVLFCLLAILQGLARSHAVSVIPGSARQYSGHTYCLLTPSTWSQAEAFAQTLGAHLAAITDAAENDWVYQTYLPFLGSNGQLWIGLFQLPDAPEPAGGWQWVDGTPLGYTNWGTIEPNDWLGEDYGQIIGPSHPTDASLWNDCPNQGLTGDGEGIWGPYYGVAEFDVTPGVLRVIPNQVGNAGSVTVTVFGTGFENGATVTVCRSDDPATCISASDVNVISVAELAARFDFGGAPLGSVWDLTVANPDSTSLAAPAALTLAQPQVNVSVDIVGPDAARADVATTYAVSVSNTGNRDAICPILWISLPPGVAWRIDANFLGPPDIPEVEPVDWSEMPIALETPETILIALILPAVAPGQTVAVPVIVTAPIELGSLGLRAWVSPWPIDLGALPASPSSGPQARVLQLQMEDTDCWAAVAEAAFDWLLEKGIIKAIPGAECTQQVAIWAKDSGLLIWRYFWLSWGSQQGARPYVVPWGHWGAQTLQFVLVCSKDAFPALKYPIAIIDFLKGVVTVWDVYESCKQKLDESSRDVAIRRSWDPNDKWATIGYGGIGRVGEWTGNCPPDSFLELGYVSANKPIQYVVHFENLAQATAEAESIVITDVLDPSLDWSTFAAGETRIAGQGYYPTVTRGAPSRTVTWIFNGVNLPPNQTPPDGEGSVSFTVRPLPGLATGTAIGNYATIVFDTNPPMCTNEVIHTIDSGAPTSVVDALPSYQRWPAVILSWQGEDDPAGCGVHSYSLYVSEEGAPIGLHRAGLTESPMVFTGGYDHTYDFYICGRDNAGNLEPISSTPDATIMTGYGFVDIPEGFWAFEEIYLCALAGIVQGYWNDTYRPEVAVTRDQMAVYVARTLAGGDENVPSGPAIPTFADVGTDYWAYNYMEYCYDQAVVQGYEDGTYRPALVVNRGAMAVYMARAMVAPAGDAAVPEPTEPPAPHFPDVNATNEWWWCYKHVEYCYDHGVVQGYEDDTYRPGLEVNRGQMAVYVQRAFHLPL